MHELAITRCNVEMRGTPLNAPAPPRRDPLAGPVPASPSADWRAGRNRAWLDRRHVVALNILGAPGAGKTTLLEHTIRDLGARIGIAVVQGGRGLDAARLAEAMQLLDPPQGSLLMVESTDTPAAPASLELGEHARVAVISALDAEEGALTCPGPYRACRLLLVNKADVLPRRHFDIARCIKHARCANPAIDWLPVSAKTGEGMDEWYQWLNVSMRRAAAAVAAATV